MTIGFENYFTETPRSWRAATTTRRPYWHQNNQQYWQNNIDQQRVRVDLQP